MKMSRQEWAEFKEKTGFSDNETVSQERKKQIDFDILMNVWAVQDRQWMEEYREKLRTEKQKQKELKKQARQARRKAGRIQPIGFGTGQLKPLKFDADKPFRIPDRLVSMGRDIMRFQVPPRMR